MKYIIDVMNDENDDFEKKADNVADFQVFDKNGSNISTESYATLFLSKNALLGLGTELIRLAHDFHEGKHSHIEPTTEDMMIQRMGIFFTPDSSKLILGCGEMKKIDDYFDK